MVTLMSLLENLIVHVIRSFCVDFVQIYMLLRPENDEKLKQLAQTIVPNTS